MNETIDSGRCLSLATHTTPLQIRPHEVADWPALWALLEPVFRAGETFPHDPAITEAEAKVAWMEQSQAVMVAVDAAGSLVGTYYCWQRNGFQVVGTLPGAFRHRQLGYVDALVMVQGLVEGPGA